MRDSVELVALILLLVAGHHAIDNRRRGAMLKSSAAWIAFFGGIIVLTYLPHVVVWLLRGLLILGAWWALHWLWGLARDGIYGPALTPLPGGRHMADLVLDVLDVEDRRAQRRQVKVLLRRYGPEAVLRAALQQEGPGSCLPEDLDQQAEANRELADRILGQAAKKSDRRLGRADRDFIADALLIYEQSSLAKLLSKDPEPLGTKALRRQTARMLDEQAARAPWIDVLIAAELYDETRPSGGEPDKSDLLRADPAVYAASLAFPPAGYALAGERGRGALLGFTSLVLLGYSIFTLLEARPVGWIFLAVWGLFQLLGMFSVHDLRVKS